jgi:glycerol-3-phosphate dehydrogenase
LIRDLSRLASGEFDLLIVGGGIHGLAAAYDAAQRGLTVALVERGDFGAATSFNHLKTIHGGLRYLQTADVGRMRESIRERRAFARIAPRFVSPLAFVMPTSVTLTKSPLAMRVAFAVDALVGSDRNAGLGPAHQLPAGRVISASECRALFDGAARPDVGAGAMWYDYQTVQGDRLTLAFAIAAAGHGAVLANYAEALGPLRDEGQQPRGIRAKDALTGTAFDIQARVIMNAAGPWTSSFLAQCGVRREWPLLKAMNLVTSRPARGAALVAQTRMGRALVLLPWQGRTVVGTSESAEERPAEDQAARRDEVARFLSEVNETFPRLNLESNEVTLVHRGIVPATRRRGELTLLDHSCVIDHAADGLKCLVSVVGVKYTTARAVAERAVDLVLNKLGRPSVPCRTAEVTLPTADVGARDPGDPILHALQAEMAQTLADVVVRRTGVGAAGYPGDASVAGYATAMQNALGWSDEKKAAEIATLKRFYEIQ